MAANDIPEREKLRPYLGQKVHCVGHYDMAGSGSIAHIRTALVQDVEIACPDGAEVFITHAWVQRAGEIMSEKPLRGDRLEFWATVNQYGKKGPDDANGNPTYDDAWGLTNPTDVVLAKNKEPYRIPQLRPEPPAAPVPAPPVLLENTPPTRPAPKLSEVMRAVRDLRAKVPLETLRLVAFHLQEITSVVDMVGGPDEFEALVEVLE